MEPFGFDRPSAEYGRRSSRDRRRWQRRRYVDRRIVDRRLEGVPVAVERRRGGDRRRGVDRRTGTERRRADRRRPEQQPAG